MRIRILIYTLILLFGIGVAVADEMPHASASLESNELLMGKTLRLVIDVPMPSDTSNVIFPIMKQAAARKDKYVPLLNDSVELLTKHSVSLAERDGHKSAQFHLSIQSFDSGRYVLPPFEFIVDGKPVKSNSVELNVLPVKAKADDQIEGFAAPVEPFEVNPNPEEMEESSSFLWWLIPTALLVLAFIIFVIYRYRKTGRLLLISKPLPPYAQALNKLRKLQAQNLPQKGKTKEYYTRLTDILRSYINRQFRIKTFEKTSTEILQQIKDSDDLSKFEGSLKSIFETADFVKFAKVNPSVVENSRCLTEAERFIQASHPAEETVEKKGGKK